MPSKSSSNKEATPASVLQALDKTHKNPPPPALERLILSLFEDAPDEAPHAFKRLKDTFVDWNECRVARRAELARLLDPIPDADALAGRLCEFLNKLFDLRGSLDLSFLQELKPTEARRHLIDLDSNLPRPVIAEVLFELCPGATIPLSPEGLKIARSHGLVGRTGTKQQLQKSMQAELAPEECARLLFYLEAEAGPAPSGKKGGKKSSPKKKSKKATKKNTAKKSGTKKAAKKNKSS